MAKSFIEGFYEASLPEQVTVLAALAFGWPATVAGVYALQNSTTPPLSVGVLMAGLVTVLLGWLIADHVQCNYNDDDAGSGIGLLFVIAGVAFGAISLFTGHAISALLTVVGGTGVAVLVIAGALIVFGIIASGVVLIVKDIRRLLKMD